ncbi:MAG: DUF1501 domain-containing protein [Pyrinomonadaceae bacterium]
MNETRRDFLKKSGGCALGMVSLATQMHHLGTMSAMAQKVIDSHSDGGQNYKALVLLFCAGGNDGNNMVIPNHNDASISNYAAYSAARGTQGLAIPQASLLPISVPRLGNLTYGLHPSLGTVAGGVNGGIHDLYNQGKLAIVTNVGTLVRPLTKAEYLNAAFRKPYQLFSHSDQVNQAQTSISNTQAFTGWGGRLSDKLTAGSNPNGLIPMVTSIAGAQLFTAGQSTLPLAMADSNTSLANVLNPAGFTNTGNGGPARLTAFNALRGLDLDSNYVAAASHVTDLAMQANTALAGGQDTSVTPVPDSSIARQLRQIARLIKSRDTLNINRQVFYAQIGGFDTHTNQLANQTTLFSQFSQAMRWFWDELVAQGIQNDVTTFTLSDFGRTLNPAGSGATVGSDHAWGNHMFVMGGSVAGGDFYGSRRPDGTGNYFPTLVMGPSGPDDTDNSTSGRGRWIPTTSVDQYAATMARWFGLSPADEAVVFPNLSAFPGTYAQLGFLP